MPQEMLNNLLLPFSAVFGAIVGSFLNAAIYRIPRNISLIKKSRSFCPQCRATISWYDNIPIISYLLLLGRCRACRKRIPPRYLLVEVLTAASFAAIFWYVRILNAKEEMLTPIKWGHPSWAHLVLYCALAAGLILAAFADMEDYEETDQEKRQRAGREAELILAGKKIEEEEGPSVYGIIPDEVTVTGLVLAIPLALLFPETHWDMVLFGKMFRVSAAFDVAFGAVLGGGLTWGVGILGKVLFRKAAMGFGDVKLMAMLGALLGWKAALLIFFLAPVFGATFGLVAMMMGGGRYLRYGPFLAFSALLIIFYQPVGTLYFDFIAGDWDNLRLHHLVPFYSFDPLGGG
jgi:leader peptidase (prepilin peptidase) / N-methyltransferase